MKFTIDIAQSIRAYGSVEVEADTIEEAVAKIDHTYVFENFTTHGSGSDDFDYSDPKDVWLGAWTNDEDEDGDVEKNLEEPTPERAFTSTVMLHGVTRNPDGSTEHSEGDGVPDEWCVWLRRDFIDADPAKEETFDSDDSREQFFKFRATANIYAIKLALELECEVDEY